MKKRNKKHEKRMKKLVVACGLCAILLAVSTYAWFIGMKTVSVSSFDVKIASIDSLSLSLDGKNWSDVVEINKNNFDLKGTPYADTNTNSWGGSGLIPMSTVGKINTESSRLTLYEKGSFTETPGGYRIMASEVKNGEAKEVDGYVAFYLFIKNLSGNEYYKDLSHLNEEAIYLTSDSKVEVAKDGVKNTGIENSVRVAFAQIGRVKATTENVSTITGITCNTAGDVTGICASRDAQIWEPNDTKHVTTALNWYNTSCRKRDNSSGNFLETNCETITGAVPTYSIAKAINSNPNADKKEIVDIYDGPEYNGYSNNTIKETDPGFNRDSLKPLVAVDTFTDSEKNLKGVARPSFMTLAPNSITKVRVYVYIEGQDIDNFDYASVGKYIKVGFGFTKQRFTSDDVGVTEGELYDNLPTAVHPTAGR